jgi:hypothetical protein
VFELNGENLGSIAIFNGQAKNISKVDSLDLLAQAINSFGANSSTNKIPLCDRTYTQVVHQYNERYEVWTVGTTIITINYVCTTHTTTSTVLPFPCDGSGDKDAFVSYRISTYSYKEVANEYKEEDNLKTFTILASGSKIDPKKENKCFDVSKSAELTIFIQQGREGTRDLVGPNEVGHVFIGIKQDGIERYYGFYPETGANSAMVAIGKDYNSELRDNSKEMYHVSITKSVTGDQLNSIINYANNAPATYNVNSYACTDFGIAVGKLGGINLPVTKSSSFTFNAWEFR